MKTQRKPIVIILVLLFSSIPLGLFSLAIFSSADTGLPNLEPLDFGPELRNTNYEIDFSSFSESPRSASALPRTSAYEDPKLWLTLDSYNEYSFFSEYELRAVGTDVEIWVQTDLSYPEGDPRATPVVTDDQVEYLLGEFESNIYLTDTAIFGTPDFHDGSNALLVDWGYFPIGYYEEETGRNVILVSNVRDDAYYDSTYPYYIAGFYSPSFEAYNDRNIISIDSHDWENRMGPDVDRPYLYESTIGHEYQHLIHDDYNSLDPSWMNEASSLIAEVYCGYPIDYGHIKRFLHTPDNSLTAWGDQGDRNILADYGSSFLWAMYLDDHYGGTAFFSHFVQGGIPGVAGIEATLDFFGHEEDFIDVYHDWRIANLLHQDHGRYSYNELDLNPDTNPDLDGTGLTVHEMHGGKIPWTSASKKFKNTFSLDGDDTGISDVWAFGTDYITFSNLKELNFFLFNGDDTGYVPGWEFDEVESEWYSGARDLTDTLIFGAAHVDGGNPTLTMTTYWDIEDYWDFGFVQVSTDNGATWTSLENMYTTDIHDPSAHPDVLANLPGLTGWSAYWTDPNYGDPELEDPTLWFDYITMDFDLTPYAGQDVLIGLRYVTDWATLYEGWFVDDIVTVSGVKVEFELFYPEADFMVTLVIQNGDCGYTIRDMGINDIYEFGITFAYLGKHTEVFMLVSPIMEKGFVDYKFATWHPPRRHWRWRCC